MNLHQDSIIKSLKEQDQSKAAEIYRLKFTNTDQSAKFSAQAEDLSAAELKLIAETEKTEQLKKRVSSLASRLTTMSSELEKERKKRFDMLCCIFFILTEVTLVYIYFKNGFAIK